MTFICKFCESTEFNIVDGWYYCTDCHRQNEQEVEFDVFNFGADTAARKTKIQETATSVHNFADKTELTTWEAFNFILHGLVEELIAIGVNPQVKLTVFQMWAHYLRTTEVAFFNKKEPVLPRLPPIFTKRDADILYNHQRRIRKRRRSGSIVESTDTPPSTNRAKRRKITRLVDQSQFSEHLSELNDSKTDINKTLTSLADVSVSEIRTIAGSSEFGGTGSNRSSLAIEFSTYARSIFKTKVPKSHISKHSEDFEGDLKCHVIKTNDLGRDRFKLLSRKTLFSILYCALNYHKEPLEIGDLIRFCREGHLSYNCARKFIPRNLSDEEIDKLNTKYTLSRVNEVAVHSGWREFICEMANFMKIELEQPDLFALSHRYVEDLCLPDIISTYTERILAFCPSYESEAKVNGIPVFEGRAMACILFVLKLLFGLDDATEYEISESSKKINKKLEMHEKKFKLFVFSEWMEYIVARQMLIEQLHPPNFTRTSRTNTERYLQHIFVKSQQLCVDDQSISDEIAVKNAKNSNSKVNQRKNTLLHFAKYINEVEKSRDPQLIEANLVKFPPSLIPNLTYLEMIREKHAEKVQIPPCLLIDHSKRDLKSLLDPLELHKELLQTRTKLEIEESCINNQIKFKRWTIQTHEKESFLHYNAVDFRISDSEWIEKLKKREERYDRRLKKDENRTHKRRFAKFQQKKDLRRQKPFTESTIFGPEEPCELPEINSADFDETITLKVPHFYYWNNFYHSEKSEFTVDTKIFKETERDLPKTFLWLLEYCAQMIEISPMELYSQLLIVENQFLFAMKPMSKIKDKIRYRSKQELPKKMSKIIQNVRKYW
ncbi:TATA box-binding protein-associated factor RNA polymerase I subunit B-like [Culicoides brevitarsis]|uniref:TATA box-binding protein-associated factor RNA polymerase I subunit B-like n=1 Tax=Culicoides brevitarsis TaxID=469753 RepID=UPI00307B16A7